MIDLRIRASRTGRLSDLLNRAASCNSYRIIIAGPMRVGAPGDAIMPSVIHPARSLYRLDSLPAAVAIAVAPPTDDGGTRNDDGDGDNTRSSEPSNENCSR